VLTCGRFEIVGIDFQGPPSTTTIEAVSVPLNTPIRETRTRGWEGTTLRKIAQDVCDNGELALVYELSSDHAFGRIDQRQESNLKFLKRLCKQVGASVKVIGNQLVIFDEAEYEARPSVMTISGKNDPSLLSYRFRLDSTNTASSATTSYKDPSTGQLVTATFTPPTPPAVANTLHINTRPAGIGEAHMSQFNSISPHGRILDPGATSSPSVANDLNSVRFDARPAAMNQSKTALREQNKREWACDLTLIGDVDIAAGQTFMVDGFGEFNGKYIIETAEHRVTGDGGYTVTIIARRTLRGY
jgi:hypothetical protein